MHKGNHRALLPLGGQHQPLGALKQRRRADDRVLQTDLHRLSRNRVTASVRLSRQWCCLLSQDRILPRGQLKEPQIITTPMQAPDRAHSEACSSLASLWLEAVQFVATRFRGVEGRRLVEVAHKTSTLLDRKGSK